MRNLFFYLIMVSIIFVSCTKEEKMNEASNDSLEMSYSNIIYFEELGLTGEIIESEIEIINGVIADKVLTENNQIIYIYKETLPQAHNPRWAWKVSVTDEGKVWCPFNNGDDCAHITVNGEGCYLIKCENNSSTE